MEPFSWNYTPQSQANLNLSVVESPRWKFKFDVNNPNANWQGDNMKCMQCAAKVKKHGAISRCRRTSCYTLPFCWQHLKSVAHLRIGRTTLRDPATNERYMFKGLFACHPTDNIVFRANDIIVTYMGELLSENEMNDRYPDDTVAPYAVTSGHDQLPMLDSALFRGVGALANDARNQGRGGNNAKLEDVPGTYPVLKAIKTIRNGEEIFTSYGNDYWPNIHKPHSTSPVSAYKRIEYKEC